MKGKGWHLDYPEHSLAARGIRSKIKQPKKSPMKQLRALSKTSLQRPLSDSEYQRMMELGKETGLKKSIVNNKEDVRLIGDKARALMKLDNAIWDKYKWASGSDVDKAAYAKELGDYVEKHHGKLDPIYEHILEDANYHSLNEALRDAGAFSGRYEKGEEDFKKYQDMGGKTWNL